MKNKTSPSMNFTYLAINIIEEAGSDFLDKIIEIFKEQGIIKVYKLT
jgi:hypothetical protein